MAVEYISIGQHRIAFCAYNPRSWLTLCYCEWLCEVVKSVIGDDQDPVLIHQWIRERHPDLSAALDLVDDGRMVQPETGFPLTPGEEQFELPIITRLKQEASKQRGIHFPGQ